MPPVSEDMSAKLARCAYELFARQGVDAVSLESISAAAGVTKGSLYWHFNSKRAVVLAACEHYYRAYQRRVHREAALEADPVARLDRIVRFSVRSCLLDEANRVFTMEIFRLALQDEDIRRGWRQFYESVRIFYIGLIEGAGQAGGGAEAERAANLLLETMEGIKLRALFEPEICQGGEEERILADLRMIVGRSAGAAATTRAAIL